MLTKTSETTAEETISESKTIKYDLDEQIRHKEMLVTQRGKLDAMIEKADNNINRLKAIGVKTIAEVANQEEIKP